ncbi:MAG: ankyrin repeat domain-containing protein [Planctomycetaceae bacterium]|nr:ankyrin repeat domain-containing protein [Planctomycetaceae bacterium]
MKRKEAYEQENRLPLYESHKKRIEKFPNISDKTKELAFALACDDFETANALADQAEINSKIHHLGSSFLFHCIQFGANDLTYPGRIRWLLEHGIDTNSMIYVMHRSTLQEDGTYKENIIFEIPIEHYAGYSTIVAEIIARNPESVNQKNPNTKQTALGTSAVLGYKETIELLLAQGASIDLPGKNDETPFVQSIKHLRYDVALLLISYGADANIPFTVREFNQVTGNIDLVKYENALDFLLRSIKSIEESKHYEEKDQKGDYSPTVIRLNAQKALITLLKKLERLKQAANIQSIKSENEK